MPQPPGPGSILELPRPTFPHPPLPPSPPPPLLHPPPRSHSPPRISAAAAAAGPRYPPAGVAGSRERLRSRVPSGDGRGARRMAADCAAGCGAIRVLAAAPSSPSSSTSSPGPACQSRAGGNRAAAAALLTAPPAELRRSGG